MEWEVCEYILSPATGTVFVAVESAKKLKMILWYQGDFIIGKGAILVPTTFGIAVNGTLRNITALRAFPWDETLWKSFRLRSDCPGNTLPNDRPGIAASDAALTEASPGMLLTLPITEGCSAATCSGNTANSSNAQ